MGKSFLIAFAALILISGCGDIEWNWDVQWWKEPKRVVPPARSTPATSEPTVATGRAGPVDESESLPPISSGETDEPAAPSAAPSEAVVGKVALAPHLEKRPYLQLFLVSAGAPAAPESRGEGRLVLSKASAGPCASILEMLYVPMGHSGSPTESYLVYENREEFDAAVIAAPMLDVSPGAGAISPAGQGVGSEAAYAEGVGSYMAIIDKGPWADKAMITACENRLLQALQSEDLPKMKRWCAGILAARLANTRQYDYVTSENLCSQAERLVAPGSIEQMTTRWWKADAYWQAGKFGEGSSLLELIVSDGAKRANSHIVHRAKAMLAEHAKKKAEPGKKKRK